MVSREFLNTGAVNLGQGKVEDGSSPCTHPLRKSRIKQETADMVGSAITAALEMATVIDRGNTLIKDIVFFKSLSRMEAGE